MNAAFYGLTDINAGVLLKVKSPPAVVAADYGL